MASLLPVRSGPASLEPLWREATGDVLRARRHERGEKLSETAGRAGISTQYLSEIERGLKDPSSEVLSAVVGALDLTLLARAVGVARRLQVVRDVAPSMQLEVGPLRSPFALAA